jgi:thymidylate kinase
VRPSKLVLVEGIPGAGKSSTCQLVRRCLDAAGQPAVWWHEEQRGHPVYVFDDRASLQATLADLGAGRSAAVVERALDRWAAFVEGARRRDEVVLVDSCLYGYLTWTLFWYDVPAEEIAQYLAAVERTVRPLAPRLVYLRQDDVDATLASATDARANGHREMYVERAEGSPYGRRRGLRGFDGLIAYWEAYRALTDELFARSALERLALASAIGWPARRRTLLEFLDLPDAQPPPGDVGRFVGWYDGTEVRLEQEDLYAYDLPDRWHRLRLVPLGGRAFEVESLPHRVVFEEDAVGRVTGLRVTGPPMLVTPALDRRLSRSDPPDTAVPGRVAPDGRAPRRRTR